jgi:hypothetical protein
MVSKMAAGRIEEEVSESERVAFEGRDGGGTDELRP